jgi:hypothetical protein
MTGRGGAGRGGPVVCQPPGGRMHQWAGAEAARWPCMGVAARTAPAHAHLPIANGSSPASGAGARLRGREARRACAVKPRNCVHALHIYGQSRVVLTRQLPSNQQHSAEVPQPPQTPPPTQTPAHRQRPRRPSPRCCRSCRRWAARGCGSCRQTTYHPTPARLPTVGAATASSNGGVCGAPSKWRGSAQSAG